MKNTIVYLSLACTLALSSLTHSATPKVLEWDDLIPPDVMQMYMQYLNQTIEGGIEIEMPMTEDEMGRVRRDMDGQLVKLPGYIVPLQADSKKVTEFLLVPYFGACIHVPPPPANQIVFVRYPEGLDTEWLYSAIWVTGLIRAENIESEMATSGYMMEAKKAVIYEEP